MAEKNTQGAVHLTSLSLDLTEFNKNIQQIQDSISQTADFAVQNLSKMQEALNKPIENMTLNVNTQQFTQGINEANASVEKFSNNFRTVTREMQNSQFIKLDTSDFDKMAEKLGATGDKVKETSEKLKELFSVIGEYNKISISGAGGELFQAVVTSTDEAGNSIRKVIDLTQEFTRETLNSSSTVLTNVNKSTEALSKQYDSLQKRMAAFIATISGSDIRSSGMEKLAADAKSLEKDIAQAVEELKKSGFVTVEQEKQYESLVHQLNRLNIAFSSNKTSANEYKKSLAPIEQQAKQTVDALKVLEKSATFTTSKQKVAELRAEYEQFINQLKTTNIGTDKAYSELDKLEKKFTELEGTIKTGHTWLENWVNKISESAKWQIANSALNLIRQSFGNLTGTIIETENSVIELQRVLNDKSLANSAISQELYNIAYEFGQTFDAVQEVAVKFAQTGIGWKATVDATRATMLGLNTAELEVSSATEGLIAVMAQFNIDAKDLESVIDKINKTADNFPVTSEKIVAALQRAGGTAKAFGLSLEETIGIITALGEATGRAGEAIGTAMNSLISFSMKDTSLAKFSEFLGKDVSDYGVLELWQELSKAIKNAGDEGEAFAKKMATSEEFTGLMNEELASAIGLTEEYNKATEETNQMLKDGKDIYSVVGTYRQNYFIALLNNIDTAIKAIQNMGDAVGYSMRENETAMEAFSKKWNQLVIAAQELAIQFGEAGFLDLMKGVVEASSAVLKLTQSFGGLRTAMLATSTLMFTIKKNKINETIDNIRNSIVKTTVATEAAATATNTASAATNTLTISIGALKLSLGGIVAIASLVATALSAVFGWMKQTREEADRARQEAIEAGNEAVQKSKELSEAYREYDKARSAGSSDERRASTEKLIQLLGYEISDVEILIKRYGSLEEAIESLMDAEYERNKEAAKNAYEAKKSEEEFQEVKRQSIEASREDIEVLERLNEAGYNYSGWINALKITGKDINIAFELPDFNSAKTKLDEYNQMLEEMDSILTADEKSTSKFYQSVLKARDALSAYITEVEDLKEKYEQYGMSREEYDRNMAEAEAKFNEAMKETSVAVGQTVDALEAMEEAIDSLNKKVNSFQSAYKTLTDVIEEYNKTGYLSADNLQTLLGLEPEYIALLENHNGQLSINQEKLQELIATQDQYMDDLTALTIAKNIDNMVTEAAAAATAGLTLEEYKAQVATQNLQSTTYALVKQLLNGEISADGFKSAIANIGTQAGITGGILSEVTNNIVDMTNAMSGFYSASNQFGGRNIDEIARSYGFENSAEPGFKEWWAKKTQTTGTVKTNAGTLTRYYAPSVSKSSGGSKSSGDPYKAEKDALKELLDVYEHSIYLIEKNEKTSQSSADKIVAIYRKMQEAVHAQAEKYRAAGVSENDSMIRDLQKQWWQYQDKIEEVLENVYDEIVNVHKNAINVLEHEYDSAEQRLDYSYMGENLKKQLDYQVKIQKEAERELERLAKLGMDANSDAAQDVINTWYDAEKAIREIGQKIASDILDPFDDFIDLADHFELWEYMDFTKVNYLRDKLAALNKLLEDGTITAKQYSEQLKSISYAIYDAQKELYEQEKQTVSDNLKNVTEGYKAQQDDLKKQKEQLNDYYDTIIDGYNKEIEAWNEKKEQVSDYYDTLIDNLRDVEKANERINKQVDYYNSRQKIITNLEQAQARSGVEWREKEMQYQQDLMNLDEEWRRTLEEWSIEDQITALEKLKESAIADIDLSIQKIRDTITMTEEAKNAAIEAIEAEINAINDLITAAEEAAEAEIEVINDKIKEMSQFIAESIKNGTVDGLVDSREEFDKALVDGTNAMLDFIDNGKNAMIDGAEQTANGVYGIYYTDFISPMNESISNIASTMATSIASGAEQGAKQALSTFQTSFITPLKNQMASLMKDVQTANTTIANASTTSTVSAAKKLTEAQKFAFNAGAGPVAAITPSITSKPSFNRDVVTNTPLNNIYITNINRGTEDAASKTQRALAALGYVT